MTLGIDVGMREQSDDRHTSSRWRLNLIRCHDVIDSFHATLHLPTSCLVLSSNDKASSGTTIVLSVIVVVCDIGKVFDF